VHPEKHRIFFARFVLRTESLGCENIIARKGRHVYFPRKNGGISSAVSCVRSDYVCLFYPFYFYFFPISTRFRPVKFIARYVASVKRVFNILNAVRLKSCSFNTSARIYCKYVFFDVIVIGIILFIGYLFAVKIVRRLYSFRKVNPRGIGFWP